MSTDKNSMQVEPVKNVKWLFFWLIFFLLLSISFLVRLSTNIPRDETLESQLYWMQWALAGASGTLIYLLWEAARQYRKIFSTNKDSNEKVDFAGLWPWYLVAAIRGPIIVVVILFTLTSINFSSAFTDDNAGEALSFAFNLNQASQQVLNIFAFFLGYYNRLALSIFESIAKYLFKDAWDKAYPKKNKLEDSEELINSQ